jgi:hypothetical protein
MHFWAEQIGIHGQTDFCDYMRLYDFACGSVWCETWSLALREQHRLREFENRVLRRIFGQKSDEVKGG